MSISCLEIIVIILTPTIMGAMCYFAFIHGPRELEKRNKKNKKK